MAKNFCIHSADEFRIITKAKTDRHGWLMVGVQTKGSRNTKLAPPTARLWQVTLPP
jgi:hypothetical protein